MMKHRHTRDALRVASKIAATHQRCVVTLARAEEIVGQPASKWRGECYGVSCKLADSGALPRSTAVYGTYLGPVSKSSTFDCRRPFQRHGWVLYGEGALLDPTRWVFEDVEPYLYWSSANDKDYDEGNSAVRKLFQRPAPRFNPLEKRTVLSRGVLPHTDWKNILGMLDDSPERPARTICLSEVFWLANLTLDALGEMARPLFLALQAVSHEAMIPVDNFRRVVEGRWPERPAAKRA